MAIQLNNPKDLERPLEYEDPREAVKVVARRFEKENCATAQIIVPEELVPAFLRVAQEYSHLMLVKLTSEGWYLIQRTG